MILVTGAAGFIGSNLCLRLAELGRPYVAIDALHRADPLVWREVIDGAVKASYWDLVKDAAPGRLARWLADTGMKITHVVHLAAESHVDRSLVDSSIFWSTQVLGTQYLIKELLSLGTVEVFINQITDEAYGPITEEQPPAVEGSFFNPQPPYACSKVAQYYVGKSYLYSHGFPVISTFPVNNFGPRQHVEKAIPCFITSLMKGEKIPLMASTHYQRDWLPVSEMVNALLLLLDKGSPGEDYNVGYDNHLTNMELASRIIMLFHGQPTRSDDAYGARTLNGDVNDYIQIVPDRKVHDCRYAVNSSKIRQLGWEPTTPFDRYLLETIRWYKNRYSNELCKVS